jgi:electron transfer flavoprotein beta subunit
LEEFVRKVVVLAKQVPDTANVAAEAMKPDGTVNRSALPAIFNPEDLNALEMALQVKEQLGCEVHVVTMGPPSATAVLQHSLYLGADKVWLLSDKRFAGADTLATSHVLAKAIEHIGDVSMVFAGRQAIDGDTAQVGPQVANLLDFSLVAFVTKLSSVSATTVVVERDAEVQTEVVEAPFPVLLTVSHEANVPRYPNANRMLMHFRNEKQIPVLGADMLKIPEEKCGLKGSPTKVFAIKNIQLSGGAQHLYESADVGIRAMVRDIVKDYTEVAQ